MLKSMHTTVRRIESGRLEICPVGFARSAGSGLAGLVKRQLSFIRRLLRSGLRLSPFISDAAVVQGFQLWIVLARTFR